MEIFIEFIQLLVFGISSYLNVFFDITVFDINYGALFVIGSILAFVSWLIWG